MLSPTSDLADIAQNDGLVFSARCVQPYLLLAINVDVTYLHSMRPHITAAWRFMLSDPAAVPAAKSQPHGLSDHTVFTRLPWFHSKRQGAPRFRRPDFGAHRDTLSRSWGFSPCGSSR